MRIVTAAIAFGIVSFLFGASPAFADGLNTTERNTATLTSPQRVIFGYSHETMQGWEPSAYTGKFYYKHQESWRKCVQHRESRHRYGAANSSSSARGAYQFLDSQWRESLSHMIYPELRKMYGEPDAKLIRDTLQQNPIHKWSREIQDMAFYTVLNYEGKWSGKKHWYLYNSNC